MNSFRELIESNSNQRKKCHRNLPWHYPSVFYHNPQNLIKKKRGANETQISHITTFCSAFHNYCNYTF